MQCRRGLAMRILSVCLSVRLFVRPSVRRVISDKMEERSVQIFVTYEGKRLACLGRPQVAMHSQLPRFLVVSVKRYTKY